MNKTGRPGIFAAPLAVPVRLIKRLVMKHILVVHANSCFFNTNYAFCCILGIEWPQEGGEQSRTCSLGGIVLL